MKAKLLIFWTLSSIAVSLVHPKFQRLGSVSFLRLGDGGQPFSLGPNESFFYKRVAPSSLCNLIFN
jgi:hypothetical protein